MSDQFVAEIRIFPFNFAPIGWAICAGQILPISQNPALFSLLGTNFGGNGTSNFALPNLQGNVPVDQGEGNGLSPYFVGQSGGSQTVTLTSVQSAVHAHGAGADTGDATANDPGGNIYMRGNSTQNGQLFFGYPFTTQNSGATTMATTAITSTGGNAAHNNMMPYLTLNFCIALQGIFPPRS